MGTHPIFESDFDCLTEMGELATEQQQQQESQADAVIVRRNRRGSKRAQWANWSDQPFNEMESIHAAQMIIQQRIRADRLQIEHILDRPDGADEDVWKYEHLRQFCLELNGLATRLQLECSPSSCSQMTATDQWIFLCAAHKSPKECSAIDYTRHTLDGAASLLNNSKYFPSRVSLKLASVSKLGSVSRRIYRIFSHAYYHHKPIFVDFENAHQLCRRFTKFVTKYDLMPKDNLIVPVDSLESGLIKEHSITTVTTSPSNGGGDYDTSTIARPSSAAVNAPPPEEEALAETTTDEPSTAPPPPTPPSETTNVEPSEQAVVDTSEPPTEPSDGEKSAPEWNGNETVISAADLTVTEESS